jgi:hypothetical protein
VHAGTRTRTRAGAVEATEATEGAHTAPEVGEEIDADWPHCVMVLVMLVLVLVGVGVGVGGWCCGGEGARGEGDCDNKVASWPARHNSQKNTGTQRNNTQFTYSECLFYVACSLATKEGKIERHTSLLYCMYT